MIARIQSTTAAVNDEIRRRYKAEIKEIFGSYARGNFHADSDLDLLVNFDFLNMGRNGRAPINSSA